MSSEEICTDLGDDVLTVRLDRPDRLNAYTSTMQSELLEV